MVIGGKDFDPTDIFKALPWGSCYDNYEVICSELIDIRAEWRVFVRYGNIVDVRGYKGDWKLHYDSAIIERCVASYYSQTAAFAMDMGMISDGRTVLIEINDGFSVGAYGLFHIDYAKFLATRWAELTGIDDEYDFLGEKMQWKR